MKNITFTIEKQMTYENKKKLMQLYTKEVTDNQIMKDLLIEILQTFDSQPYIDVQNTNNPVGFLRSKIDKFLNK